MKVKPNRPSRIEIENHFFLNINLLVDQNLTTRRVMFSFYFVNNRELSGHSLDESMSSTLVYQVAALVIEHSR